MENLRFTTQYVVKQYRITLQCRTRNTSIFPPSTTKFLICYIVIPIAVADAKDPLQPNPLADNVNI